MWAWGAASPSSRRWRALGLAAIDPPATVVDLVYGDEATPVAEWAAAAGSRVVEGLEVLVRQGARSLELWTGREPPMDVMRQIGAARPTRRTAA